MNAIFSWLQFNNNSGNTDTWHTGYQQRVNLLLSAPDTTINCYFGTYI